MRHRPVIDMSASGRFTIFHCGRFPGIGIQLLATPSRSDNAIDSPISAVNQVELTDLYIAFSNSLPSSFCNWARFWISTSEGPHEDCNP
jgi:hypothetical protein